VVMTGRTAHEVDATWFRNFDNDDRLAGFGVPVAARPRSFKHDKYTADSRLVGVSPAASI